jgi:hypothetical protein
MLLLSIFATLSVSPHLCGKVKRAVEDEWTSVDCRSEIYGGVYEQIATSASAVAEANKPLYHGPGRPFASSTANRFACRRVCMGAQGD